MASRSLEEDYDKHCKRIREVTSRKANILEQVNHCNQFNKFASEKRNKAMERAILQKASTSSTHSLNGTPHMKFFDKSILQTENIFKMDLNEITRAVNKIHSDLLSSSYFRQLGFDAVPEQPEISSNITVITSMSNTSNFEFRSPDTAEDTKYIKEAQPYGNPFRLIIRPKNQNIQMSEIEDEAFMTSVEKKKSNRLASYANLYKQQLANQLKKYGEWFRANQDSTALDLRIKDLIVKREEQKKLLLKREEEVKKRLDKEKIFLDKRDMDDLDSQGSIEEELMKGLAIVKPERIVLKNDMSNFKASQLLFDDLQEIFTKLKFGNSSHEELRPALKSQLMALTAKFQDQFESEFLEQKFEEFASSYFGYSV